MKTKKILLSIIIMLMAISTSMAQKKIGVFIHGFNGASEKWLIQSQAPQFWKLNGTITDYVALDYETIQLKTPQSQAQLLAKFDQKLSVKGNRSSDEWILIGHSLGGIVARALYPELKRLGYNITAIVSVAGPSQGAEATNVSTTLINTSINRMKNKINAAQEHVAPTVSYLLEMQNLFSSITGGTSVQSQIAAIPEYLEVARDTALGYANTIIESQAASLIGKDGSVVRQINSYRTTNSSVHPPNYLAIIGAEKAKIPFRMIGHIFEDEAYKDEYKVVNQITDLRNNYFSTNEGYYRQLAKRYHWCRTFPSCRSAREYAHYRENLWKGAKLEIDNIDVTWGELINSFRFVQLPVSKYVPPCDSDGGPVEEGFSSFFDIGTLPSGEECSTDPDGEYITVYEEFKFAEKNDGVVDINSVRWSANDGLNDLNNKYYEDLSVDGGYNHFELRNYKRAYTLPGVFVKGAVNPSLEEAENWISNGYRF